MNGSRGRCLATALLMEKGIMRKSVSTSNITTTTTTKFIGTGGVGTPLGSSGDVYSLESHGDFRLGLAFRGAPAKSPTQTESKRKSRPFDDTWPNMAGHAFLFARRALGTLFRNLSSTRSLRWYKSLSRWSQIIFGLLFFFTFCLILLVLTELFDPSFWVLFRLGRTVDYYIKFFAFVRTTRRWKAQLRNIQIFLPNPRLVEGETVFKTLPNAAVGAILLREVERQQIIHSLERHAEAFKDNCLSSPRGPTDFPTNHAEIFQGHAIPRIIFRPHDSQWMRPGGFSTDEFHFLTFNENQMQTLIKNQCSFVYDHYISLSSRTDQVELWALCALYRNGGVYLGKGIVDFDPRMERILSSDILPQTNKNHCAHSLGFALLDQSFPNQPQNVSTVTNTANRKDIYALAITPQHPILSCALQQIANHPDLTISSQGVLGKAFWQEFESKFEDSGVLELNRNSDAQSCVNLGSKTLKTGLDEFDVNAFNDIPSNGKSEKSHFYIDTILSQNETNPKKLQRKNKDVIVSDSTGIRVFVKEESNVPKPIWKKKITLTETMSMRRSRISWLCERCLRASIFGSFARCSMLCNKRVEKIFCSQPSDANDTIRSPTQQQKVAIQVKITGIPSPTSVQFRQNEGERTGLIPKIIHQTWFEDLTPDRYPHLVRLQNSWRYSGWEYRYYTDETARSYIEESYPPRFVDVFDALLPGAYKADFFRYLVLLKEGGIYADVDVHLDASIDHFVTPTLSFFTSRDAVGEYTNENFCLWNGLIGAMPGHPVLLRAVERLVNLALNRADQLDMEQHTCSRWGPEETESWKIRAEPGLLLSGPCALGIAANEAFGRKPLQSFDPGWLRSSRDSDPIIGDALILMQDKQDIGAHRMTDLTRNIIVASTDMPNLSKSPLNPVWNDEDDGNGFLRKGNGEKAKKKEKPHYSSASHGVTIWGTHGVYADDLVSNEMITLEVSYT